MYGNIASPNFIYLFENKLLFAFDLKVKYFDSGEYNMAKSTNRTGPNPLLGKAIPTPEAVTQRKHSTACRSKLADGEEHPEHSPSACSEHVFFDDPEKVQNQEVKEETESK